MFKSTPQRFFSPSELYAKLTTIIIEELKNIEGNSLGKEER